MFELGTASGWSPLEPTPFTDDDVTQVAAEGCGNTVYFSDRYATLTSMILNKKTIVCVGLTTPAWLFSLKYLLCRSRVLNL